MLANAATVVQPLKWKLFLFGMSSSGDFTRQSVELTRACRSESIRCLTAISAKLSPGARLDLHWHSGDYVERKLCDFVNSFSLFCCSL
jgi:hypothetical protein